ncbi:heat shock protein Hsp15 [Balneicella halophila]|uniref:Heat shock protein Hsp15 n=1 Tax=Balneicella halophila TaxID=1537566 RepID=A0A7L4UQF2_BALHA|nr:RNA-binding S4 domain-containing protein [Balneicella halophila]PVX51980.1 heat shock protein Hsp15 [Balneicella halophila]
MSEIDKIRVDKWLWAVRIFKTRSQAAEACKKRHVFINGEIAKPSREVQEGDIVGVKRAPITYEYKVLAISGKRMGAKLTPDFVKDVTPQEQLDLLEATKTRGFEYRDRGLGRPTKQERRMIEKLKGLK